MQAYMTPEEIVRSQVSALAAVTDEDERNAMALRLAEVNAPGLAEALVRLIRRPDLRNKRSVLVHALGFLDSAKHHAELLVDLVADGDFEVAHEAILALQCIEEINGPAAERLYAKVGRMQNMEFIEDWRRDLISELSAMFD
jgi:HEAT repeat protein